MQDAISSGNGADCYAELAISSPATIKTIASTRAILHQCSPISEIHPKQKGWQNQPSVYGEFLQLKRLRTNSKTCSDCYVFGTTKSLENNKKKTPHDRPSIRLIRNKRWIQNVSEDWYKTPGVKGMGRGGLRRHALPSSQSHREPCGLPSTRSGENPRLSLNFLHVKHHTWLFVRPFSWNYFTTTKQGVWKTAVSPLSWKSGGGAPTEIRFDAVLTSKYG